MPYSRPSPHFTEGRGGCLRPPRPAARRPCDAYDQPSHLPAHEINNPSAGGRCPCVLFPAVWGVAHPDRSSLRDSQEPARGPPGSRPGPSRLASAERTAGPSHHLTGAEATWAWRRCHVRRNDESASTPASNIEARRLPRGPRSPEEERGAPPRHRGQFLNERENYHLARLRIFRCFFANLRVST